MLGISAGEIHDAVIQAAKLGSLEILRLLIEVAIDISVIEALEHAALGGYIEIIKVLLEHPAVDCSSKVHLLPLLRSSNATVIGNGLKLLSKQLLASELIDERVIALMEVAKRGSVSPQITQLLLESQPSIDPQRLQHIPQTACQAGNHHMVLDLFQVLRQVDSLDDIVRFCLCTSAAQGHIDIVLFLVDHLSLEGLSSRLEVPMALAAGDGHLSIVKSLYEKISGYDDAQATLSRALVAASANGHLSTVEFILSRGASVDTIAPSTLIDCVTQGCSRCLPRTDNASGLPTLPNTTCTSLLSSTRSQKLSARSPLQACLLGFARFTQQPWSLQALKNNYAWIQTSISEQKAVLKLLVDAGANPNDIGGMNNYPICHAASHCEPEDLKHLIDAGADVNAAQALHAVVKREMFTHTLLKQLLDAGAILPLTKGAVNPLLAKALTFFCGDGRFLECTSLEEVFDDGPGAVVVDLLRLLPEEEVTDTRYGLILQMAACLNRKSIVELLLKRGIDVNIAGGHFGTALQAASYHGNIEMAKILLQHGADPNVLQGKHQTALRAAVIGNNKDLISLLIDKGASREIGAGVELGYGNRSRPILNLAVEHAAIDILKTLLSAGVDARTEYPGFEHPLMTACEKGRYDQVEVLLGAGSPVNSRGLVPFSKSYLPDERVSGLHMACHQGFSQIAGLLLDHGADPYPESSLPIRSGEQVKDDPERTPSSSSALDLAAKGGHLDCVRLLLAQEIQVYQETYGCAFTKASTYGHLNVVQEFLSRDLGTSYISDAFLSACKHRHLRIIETLLKTLLSSGDQDTDELVKNALEKNMHNKDVFEVLLDYSVVDTGTLILSCIAGSMTGVKLALENGISVDAEDGLGRRGLHTAAYNGHFEIVQQLVSRGANVECVHAVYGSPLVLALKGLLADQLLCHKEINIISDCRTDHINLRKSLGCSQGSAYRFAHYMQYTIPSSAQLLEYEHIVQFLLLHGARCEVNSNPYGDALHLAVLSGDVAIVRQILANGTDANYSGTRYSTALMTALNEKHLEIFKLLLQRGADLQYTTDEGRTPLHIACRMGMSIAIRLLISHGAGVNARDIKGLTPLNDGLQAQKEGGSQLGKQDNFPPNSVEIILRSSREVEIGEDHLLIAAAITVNHGQQSVLQSLLDYDKDLIVSESVIMKSLVNSWTDEKDLILLLSRSGGLGVTAPMLKATTDASVMEVLLGHRPICKITPEILEANTEWECVQMLLAHDGDVKPTERVIIHALKSSNIRRSPFYGVNISLGDLLDRDSNIQVTQDMLGSANDPEDMKCLLARLSPEQRISESVVLAAINKRAHGIELLRLLLNYDKAFKVSPKVIQQALLKSWVVYIFEVLLGHDPDIEITAAMFLRILGPDLGSEQRREKLVELMNRYGKKVKFTDSIKDAIDRSYPSQNQQAMRKSLHSLNEYGHVA